MSNLQVIPTDTIRPCDQCGQTYTVPKNPNQSGRFCGRVCALAFSRATIRSHDQKIADKEKMLARIRERQERDRIEAAKRHAEDLARQQAKSDAEWAAWEIRQTEIARELADEERRRVELERASMPNVEIIEIEPTAEPLEIDELNREMFRQHQQVAAHQDKVPRVSSPAVRPSASNGIFLKSSR